jgi:hypothetical protein
VLDGSHGCDQETDNLLTARWSENKRKLLMWSGCFRGAETVRQEIGWFLVREGMPLEEVARAYYARM